MLKRLGQIEFAIAFALLAIIVVLVFCAAIMRFFDYPLIWSVDMAQLLFIWLCFVGATRAMRLKAHLGVDLLVRNVPLKLRRIVETAVSILVLGFLLILTYEGYKLTMLNIEREFGDSGISYAFVTVAVPIGSIMLAIALLYNLVGAWRDPSGRTLAYSRTSEDTTPHQEL